MQSVFYKKQKLEEIVKDFELIYASQLLQKQRENRALVIDIRDRDAYEREHWPGAVNYPYEMIEEGRVRLPKNRKLILYCDHGGGSMQMARMLGEQGYQVASVVGGYESIKKISKNYFKNPRNM